MERDSRRDRGQWKGCYAFNNITCDDDRGVGPARDGGLKMGNTYHYYVSPSLLPIFFAPCGNRV